MLGAAAAWSSGVDVSSYDFEIYWQPHCKGAITGRASLGGSTILMTGVGSIDGYSGVLNHEFGHNFGAG